MISTILRGVPKSLSLRVWFLVLQECVKDQEYGNMRWYSLANDFLLWQPEREKNATVVAYSEPISKGLAICLIPKGKTLGSPSRGKKKSPVEWQKEVTDGKQ